MIADTVGEAHAFGWQRRETLQDQENNELSLKQTDVEVSEGRCLVVGES